MLLAALLVTAAPAWARPPDDDERVQRRLELRRQLEAERERWALEGGPHRAGRHPSGHPPQGWAPAHGSSRLTPEERRALRQELREQRP
jgi:hypothetical protein